MGALKPALAKFDRSEYLAARSRLLETLVTRQLMLGQDAVDDALVSDSQVAAWHDTAARFLTGADACTCGCRKPIPRSGTPPQLHPGLGPDLLPRDRLARLGKRLARRGGISQVLRQLPGVLPAYALQRLGELGRDEYCRAP